MAGELVAAGLGDDVEDDAGEVPVFSGQADAHDLGFLDDVVVDEDPGRAAVGVADADAVHLIGDAALAAGAIGDGVVVDAGRHHDNVGRELAVGDVAQDLVAEGHRGRFRGLDVDGRRLGDDRDLLLHRRRFQNQGQAQRGRRVQSDIFLNDGAEPAKLGPQAVGARRQGRIAEVPVDVADRRARAHELLAAQGQVDSGEGGPLFIGHLPGYGSRLAGLRERERRNKEEDEECYGDQFFSYRNLLTLRCFISSMIRLSRSSPYGGSGLPLTSSKSHYWWSDYGRSVRTLSSPGRNKPTGQKKGGGTARRP